VAENRGRQRLGKEETSGWGQRKGAAFKRRSHWLGTEEGSV